MHRIRKSCDNEPGCDNGFIVSSSQAAKRWLAVRYRPTSCGEDTHRACINYYLRMTQLTTACRAQRLSIIWNAPARTPAVDESEVDCAPPEDSSSADGARRYFSV